MNFFISMLTRCPGRMTLVAIAAACFPARAFDNKDIVFGAATWIQYGIVGKSTDTANGKDFDKKSLYSSGAQISLGAKLSEKLTGTVGLGVAASHNLSANSSSKGGYAPMPVSPYIAQANFTYSLLEGEKQKLSLRGGFFPYDYNPEARNLGLYLLRGPLYPGILLSGFETKYVLPIANTLGIQLRHQWGDFQHDLLLTSETEFYPYFDLSPAYIASYQMGKLLRVGAGVNFYHLIPIDDSLTNDKKLYYVDTAGGGSDTTFLTFQGVKVMANMAFDPKPLFGAGAGIFGAEDLKIYGEVALLGLNNSKAYETIYGDMMHRMPVMVGFNFPAFRLLEQLSLEVEWYGASFSDDLKGYNHLAGQPETPLPVGWFTPATGDPGLPNVKRDNWKWSLYASRVFQSHFKISLQVANDHFRPGVYQGDDDNNPPGSESLMVTPQDWYGMIKAAYFF